MVTLVGCRGCPLALRQDLSRRCIWASEERPSRHPQCFWTWIRKAGVPALTIGPSCAAHRWLS
eukprot:3100946-Heterocapsa_arctica.AAC.1